MELGTRPFFIAVARVVRPRGIRGEVLAELHTDFPERFDGLEEVWIELPDGTRQKRLLEECWPHQRRQVLKFAGIDDRSQAEGLRGAWVEIEAEEAIRPPAGDYFDHDLVGCSVLDTAGRDLGAVVAVQRIPGNPQLVVQGASGEFLLPAGGAFFREVSVEEHRIVVDVPDGLVDLNK